MTVTQSTIEWTDATWNPVTGCTKVSAGCDNCYAEGIANRFAGTAGFPNGFDVTLHPDRLDAPFGWKRPRLVFVNSMSDLFHDDIPQAHIAEVFATMAATPQHTYQILTKRHARMKSMLNDGAFVEQVSRIMRRKHGVGDPAGWWPLRNVWLGVSVEDQRWAEARIPALLGTPAAVRFLSCEPLLGPVDLRALRSRHGALIDCLTGDVKTEAGEVYAAAPGSVSWVIVGGESGRNSRPMEPAWARSLRDQCTTARVPFFFKQWGNWAPTGERGIGRFVGRERLVGPAIDDMGHREVILRRPSKKDAGRHLDGQLWDEMPAQAHR